MRSWFAWEDIEFWRKFFRYRARGSQENDECFGEVPHMTEVLQPREEVKSPATIHDRSVAGDPAFWSSKKTNATSQRVTAECVTHRTSANENRLFGGLLTCQLEGIMVMGSRSDTGPYLLVGAEGC